LLTRTGLDWTHKYPAIAAALAKLAENAAEVVYFPGAVAANRSAISRV
jgi:ATP-dependent DNA ligase